MKNKELLEKIISEVKSESLNYSPKDFDFDSEKISDLIHELQENILRKYEIEDTHQGLDSIFGEAGFYRDAIHDIENNFILENSKKVLADNNIPFTIHGEYITVNNNDVTDRGSLIDFIDAELLCENDPDKTLILSEIYEYEGEVYSALEYCGLYAGK
jgi:hypothetical protein